MSPKRPKAVRIVLVCYHSIGLLFNNLVSAINATSMQVSPMAGFELKKPPVIETSLGVQFSDLDDWSPLHHGLYYAKIRERFPRYETREPIEAIVETFPITGKIRQLQFSRGLPEIRAEFAMEDESTLISIQKNRFSFHWKGPENGDYPRYHGNKEICRREYHSFLDYCHEATLGEIKPLICEAMYLNRISPKDNESLSELCENVFGLSLGEFEATTVNRTYVMSENRGRIYAEINSVQTEDPHITFKLTSRVRHINGDALATIDSAHDWLIEKFRELTTDQAKKERWERA